MNIWPVMGEFINVGIQASPKDIGSTNGLCGVLNGDKADDFFLRNTNIPTNGGYIPDDFVQTWR